MSKTILAGLLTGLAAFGSSFTGTFNNDDDQATITFSLAAPTTIVLRSFGYAGGMNEAGDVIPDGGFDPMVTVFEGFGPGALLLALNTDGGCPDVDMDPVTGQCWDVFLQLLMLAAGDYTVVLTQYDNFANGPTLGDGFARDGQGDFTGPLFFGVPGAFIDATLDQRNGNWALDIVGIRPAAVPEPSTLGITAIGLCGLLLAALRKR